LYLIQFYHYDKKKTFVIRKNCNIFLLKIFLLLKERTKNAQFIVVSLRNNMFELCDRLFGIYKVNNCTGSTYIAPELIELDEKKKKTIVINTTDQLGRKSESNQNVKPSSSSLSTLPKIVEAIEEDLSCVQMNTN